MDCQSIFTGYTQTETVSKVIALFHDNESVEHLQAGQPGRIFLKETPFYAESGGQVGDKGTLVQGNTVFVVADTQKVGQASVHLGQLTTGTLKIGDELLATIDIPARRSIARNHSATHLLHAALRQTLGEHIAQKGSLVEPERLRFDFSHFEPLKTEELHTLERLVNQQILRNLPICTEIMALEDAIQSGAVALFGEKYTEKVRVLSIGDFSTELCGGTHVQQSGDIGLFKIISETGIAAGIRRIEAITGEYALTWVNTLENTFSQVTGLLKTHRESVVERLTQVLEQSRQNEKELARLQAKLASSQGDDLTQQAVEVKGVKILASRLDNVEVKQLRDMLDQLKNKLGTAVIVLATVKGEKVSLIAGVTADLTAKMKAGDLVNYVAQQVGGKGGGRADMAQAGGTNPDNLLKALESVKIWVTDNF
jgi:alanyl-tRNA synthetase